MTNDPLHTKKGFAKGLEDRDPIAILARILCLINNPPSVSYKGYRLERGCTMMREIYVKKAWELKDVMYDEGLLIEVDK